MKKDLEKRASTAPSPPVIEEFPLRMGIQDPEKWKVLLVSIISARLILGFIALEKLAAAPPKKSQVGIRLVIAPAWNALYWRENRSNGFHKGALERHSRKARLNGRDEEVKEVRNDPRPFPTQQVTHDDDFRSCVAADSAWDGTCCDDP